MSRRAVIIFRLKVSNITTPFHFLLVCYLWRQIAITRGVCGRVMGWVPASHDVFEPLLRRGHLLTGQLKVIHPQEITQVKKLRRIWNIPMMREGSEGEGRMCHTNAV